MKSATEWGNEDPAYCVESDCSQEEHEKWIREIQIDALTHAADICSVAENPANYSKVQLARQEIMNEANELRAKQK